MASAEQRLMDLARTVPATLLLVGTSETVVTAIKGARELLAGAKWNFDDSDDPETPPSSTAPGGGCVVGELVETATGGGARSARGVPLKTSCGASQGSLHCGVPANDNGGNGTAIFVETATGGGDHSARGVPLKPTCGSQDMGSLLYVWGVPVNDNDGNGAAIFEEGTPSACNYWADADVLASALAPEGHLPVAYREITRLVALHAEAGHVFVACTKRLGLKQDDDDDARIGLQPDHGAPWRRWVNLREAAVRHAHDALLALSSAASAATAAEDFLRWRSVESPRREGWRSAVRQLVQDARSSLGDAKEAVRLMHDAVLCEFFEIWTILNRE